MRLHDTSKVVLDFLYGGLGSNEVSCCVLAVAYSWGHPTLFSGFNLLFRFWVQGYCLECDFGSNL